MRINKDLGQTNTSFDDFRAEQMITLTVNQYT